MIQPMLLSYFGDDYGTLGFDFKKLRKSVGKFARKTVKVYTAPYRFAAKKVGKFARKTVKVYTAPYRFAAKKVFGKKLSKKVGLHGLHPLSGVEAQNLLMGSDIPWDKTANYYYDDQGNLYMGSLWSKVKGVAKKIGKFTSPITTAVAKRFLPDSWVNAAAKLDPTTTKPNMANVVASVKSMLPKTETQQTISAIGKTAMNPLVLAIAGAGVLAIVLMSKKRR